MIPSIPAYMPRAHRAIEPRKAMIMRILNHHRRPPKPRFQRDISFHVSMRFELAAMPGCHSTSPTMALKCRKKGQAATRSTRTNPQQARNSHLYALGTHTRGQVGRCRCYISKNHQFLTRSGGVVGSGSQLEDAGSSDEDNERRDIGDRGCDNELHSFIVSVQSFRLGAGPLSCDG